MGRESKLILFLLAGVACLVAISESSFKGQRATAGTLSLGNCHAMVNCSGPWLGHVAYDSCTGEAWRADDDGTCYEK